MRQWTEWLMVSLTVGGSLLVAFVAGYYAHAFSLTVPALRLPLPGLRATEPDYPVLAEARALLEAHFNGPQPSPQQAEYGLVRGLVSAYNDPYTLFVEPQPARLEAQTLQGEYGGIGAALSVNDAGQVTLDPFLDSPAALAGVQKGDRLTQVDDWPVPPAPNLDDVVARVRGLVGTPVVITVTRLTATLAFTITRQTIELPSVTADMLAGEVGLLTLTRFSQKTPQEVRVHLADLRARGAQRLVVDVRNNGGGLLTAAVDTASLFLDGGVVLIETNRQQTEKVYTAPANNDPATRLPLVILVNGNTASAAEIFAGALQDRGRAPLVGQTTFGKGSVQFIFPLRDGSSLHISANQWLTPNRRQITGQGLTPNQVVEGDASAQLQAALDLLNAGR